MTRHQLFMNMSIGQQADDANAKSCMYVYMYVCMYEHCFLYIFTYSLFRCMYVCRKVKLRFPMLRRRIIQKWSPF